MQLLSLQEATKKLGGISLSLLRKAVADGRLEVIRVGRRVLVDAEYLEKQLRSGQLFRPKEHSGRPGQA